MHTVGIHVQGKRRSSACGKDENDEGDDDRIEEDTDVDILKVEA